MQVGGINKQIIEQANQARKKTSQNQFEEILKSAAKNNDDQQLRKVCNQFEQIFLQMMYKQMKSSVDKSELLSGGYAGEVFESMLDEKLMENASDTSALGISDMLYKQLKQDMGSSITKQDSQGVKKPAKE